MKKILLIGCFCLFALTGVCTQGVMQQEESSEIVAIDPSCAGFDLREKSGRLLSKEVVETSDAYQKGLRNGYRVIGVQRMGSDQLEAIRELLCEQQGEVEVMFVDNVGEVRTVMVQWTPSQK